MLLSMSICLGDNMGVRTREPVGLDTLEEPPERHGIGHITGSHLTRTASKHATDMALNVSNY
jgi:hypothetical protein